MNLNQFNIPDVDSIAENILSSFPDSRIFAFYGEMGVGKTTLIKALCLKLGVKDGMSSPTYSIVNQYTGSETIYHIDLYRLNDIKEALSIGIEEYLNSGNYCFVEWPQIIEPLLKQNTVKIQLELNTEDTRRLNIEKV
jgi:tRNA threonylcarbamoyladenosine biosynthesis protein TsaE